MIDFYGMKMWFDLHVCSMNTPKTLIEESATVVATLHTIIDELDRDPKVPYLIYLHGSEDGNLEQRELFLDQAVISIREYIHAEATDFRIEIEMERVGGDDHDRAVISITAVTGRRNEA